ELIAGQPRSATAWFVPAVVPSRGCRSCDVLVTSAARRSNADLWRSWYETSASLGVCCELGISNRWGDFGDPALSRRCGLDEGLRRPAAWNSGLPPNSAELLRALRAGARVNGGHRAR